MHLPGVELQGQQCRAAAKNTSVFVACAASTHQQETINTFAHFSSMK
jgi:hypothetical protein